MSPTTKTRFTKKLGNTICSLVAEGLPLDKICDRLQIANASIVHNWLTDPSKIDFSDEYQKASNIKADKLFDEMLSIADNHDDDSPTTIQRAKLQIETRKWILSRLSPDKYKQQIDSHTQTISLKIEKEIF